MKRESHTRKLVFAMLIMLFHAQTKHTEVHHHFIRKKVLKDDINLLLVKTEEHIVDIFTKG
jgi:hypothetical protein